MAQVEVENLLLVSDYLAKAYKASDGCFTMPGHDEAFRLASNNTEGALSAVL